MAIQTPHETEQEILRSGRYAPISSTTIEGTTHPVTLNGFVRSIEAVHTVLEGITRRTRNAIFMVEASSSLTVTVVVPSGHQGSLFGGEETPQTEHDQLVFDGSPESPAAPGTGPRDASKKVDRIEQSAQAEAELLALEGRRISIAAIDVGNNLAIRAESEPLRIEDLPAVLSGSPSEKISRAAYSLARDTERRIRFLADNRVIGGRKQIPADLLSERIFALRGCHILASADGRRFRLRGQSDDPEWIDLIRSYPDALRLQTIDSDTAMETLRLAEATNLPIDLDVCVAERVKTGKRSITPIRVCNLAAFIAALRERLNQLEEQDAAPDADTCAE